MRPGRLRHRITIEERFTGQDPVTGAVTGEWVVVQLDSDTPLENIPAEVLTGPGREFQSAQAPQAETTARINLRWFPGLRQDMRILWDGRVYNIGSIETDRTGRLEWRLQCVDGVNDGR